MSGEPPGTGERIPLLVTGGKTESVHRCPQTGLACESKDKEISFGFGPFGLLNLQQSAHPAALHLRVGALLSG